MDVRALTWAKKTCGALVLLGLSALPAVASAQSDEDPWEGFNRAIFSFNETVDTYSLKPLAQGYQAITPQFLEDGIHNVYSNVGDVGNLANNLFQWKWHNAGVDTARLMFNTTFGLLGFFDVATHMGLVRNDEDFGQTLAAWGVESGPYLVLPLLGPSTVRDAIGKVPDGYVRPYPYMNNVRERNVALGLNIIDTRASLLPLDKLVTGDKYVFMRNAYLQHREFKINDGEVIDDF